MATKKTHSKKVSSKKAPAPRKTATKKTSKVKSASARTSLRRHFSLQPEETAFMTFRLTKQTLYWLVLGLVVIMFTLWLTKLQADIQDLYDQVDASTAELSTM